MILNASAKFCINEKIEIIVVGPEEPLVNGLYDYFKSREELQEIYFIGPSKQGAQLEGRRLLQKHLCSGIISLRRHTRNLHWIIMKKG